MRILELIATVLGLSVFSMSCSSGHGTAPQTPLTDAQKATLKTTVSNLTLISNAASSGAMTSQTGTSTSVVSTSDSSVPPQQQKMVQSLNKSSCAYQMTPITDTDSTTSPFNFSLQVNGSGCPVSMNYKITSGAAQGNQQSIQFDMEYLVMDNNFRALNDIDQISVHGPMSFNQSLNTFSSDLQGSIHSQLNGPITYAMVGQTDPKNNRATLDVKYTFPAFIAEIVGVGDASGNNVTYTINGQTISTDEFNSYMAFNTASGN